MASWRVALEQDLAEHAARTAREKELAEQAAACSSARQPSRGLKNPATPHTPFGLVPIASTSFLPNWSSARGMGSPPLAVEWVTAKTRELLGASAAEVSGKITAKRAAKTAQSGRDRLLLTMAREAKTKSATRETKTKSTKRARSTKRTKDVEDDSDQENAPTPEERVRHNPRSQRQRFRPLEYWKGERVVYGQQADGAAPFESVVDVVILEREDE